MNLLVNIAARFLPKRKFHSTVSSRARASLTAGCNRIGCGHLFQVFCGIFITVVFGAALANPVVASKWQRIANETTDVTGFRGRKPAGNSNNCAFSKRCFVAELFTHFCHCRVHYRFSKISVSRHSLDVQVLNSDESKSFDERSRQVVRYVCTNIGDPFVESCQLHLCFMPVFSSFITPGKFLIQFPDPFLHLPQNTRRFDSLSGRKNSKIDDSEVHTYHSLCFAMMRIGPRLIYSYLDREIPMACVFGETGRQYFVWESKRLSGTDPAKLRNFNPTTIKLKGTALNSKSFATTIFLFKLGVTGFLTVLESTKEVLKGRPQVLKSVAGNSPRNLSHPSQITRLTGIQFSIKLAPVGFFANPVHLLPACETPVEGESSRSSTPIEERSLNVVGVKPDALAKNGHWSIFSRMSSRRTCDKEQRRRLASASIHALRSGSRCMVTGSRFMVVIYHQRDGAVKTQLNLFSFNNKSREIVGECEVRQRV